MHDVNEGGKGAVMFREIEEKIHPCIPVTHLHMPSGDVLYLFFLNCPIFEPCFGFRWANSVNMVCKQFQDLLSFGALPTVFVVIETENAH
jgi:hypothetical protein